MHFHDKTYLSGNVAQFQVVDMNNMADAWFVSIYDPNKNQKSNNAPENQRFKAIVVHWYLIPDNVHPQAGFLQNVLASWDGGHVKSNLNPQFIPQQ